MHLALPPQTAPNASSFPQNRDAVRTWLGELNPSESPDHASELLRGLRHSNRLTSDSDTRRSVLEEFRTVLTPLVGSLSRAISPQPLPMATSFRHASALLDELLREEANAWKILLSQSQTPRLDDAEAALNALYRLAVAAVQQYRNVPKHCMRDANHIFAIVDGKGLLGNNPAKRNIHDDNIALIRHWYAGILTLATLNLKQIRAKQLGLTLTFLADHFDKVEVSAVAPAQIGHNTLCVINLHSSDVPTAASCYLGDLSHSTLRWVDFSPLMEAIEIRLAKTRTTFSVTLGADTLERQTLSRLSFEFTGARDRKLARCVSYNNTVLAFGHQQIANQLLREVDASSRSDHDDSSVEWMRINHSSNGAAFSSITPVTGTVHVGELVATNDEDTHTLGVIRWVQSREDGTLRFGMEYLSNDVVPVELTRDNAEEGVTDEALIIACRVSGKVTQTILLPGYRFHTGDRLTASQVSRRKQIKLGQCLQSNGMFSQFVLNEG